MTKTLIPLAVAGLVLAGCGGPAASQAASASRSSTATTPTLTRFEQARSTCGTVGALADGGRTLILDTQGKDDAAGDDTETVFCILDVLDMPASVDSHVRSTRALDGMQTDEWATFKARWTYHPDNGLQITVTDS